jgi:hypothetical protein
VRKLCRRRREIEHEREHAGRLAAGGWRWRDAYRETHAVLALALGLIGD